MQYHLYPESLASIILYREGLEADTTPNSISYTPPRKTLKAHERENSILIHPLCIVTMKLVLRRDERRIRWRHSKSWYRVGSEIDVNVVGAGGRCTTGETMKFKFSTVWKSSNTGNLCSTVQRDYSRRSLSARTQYEASPTSTKYLGQQTIQWHINCHDL